MTATLALLMKKLALKEKSTVALTRGRVWRTLAGLEILDGREEESTHSCGPEREPWSGGAAPRTGSFTDTVVIQECI